MSKGAGKQSLKQSTADLMLHVQLCNLLLILCKHTGDHSQLLSPKCDQNVANKVIMPLSCCLSSLGAVTWPSNTSFIHQLHFLYFHFLHISQDNVWIHSLVCSLHNVNYHWDDKEDGNEKVGHRPHPDCSTDTEGYGHSTDADQVEYKVVDEELLRLQL